MLHPGGTSAMTCELHAFHRPEPQGTQRHHVLLKTWTDALGLPESRTIRACPTGHSNLHYDLRAALRGQPYRAGAKSQAIIDEAIAFYEAHPEAHHYLWTLADRLVEDEP